MSPTIYVAPPPNEGEGYIADLKFGNRDYEEERDKWYIKRSKLRHGLKKAGCSLEQIKKALAKIPHWRDTLIPPDNLALIPIWEDPVEFLKPEAYAKKYTPYWCPSLMGIEILKFPLLVQSDLIAAKKSFPYGCERQVSSALIKFFRTDYRDSLLSKHPEYAANWPKALDLFKRKGSIIVARWCLEQFCTEDAEWIGALAQHGDLETPSSFTLAVSSKDTKCAMILDDIEDDASDREKMEEARKKFDEQMKDKGFELDD